eukprot:1780072-Rhodomonas_salina.1
MTLNSMLHRLPSTRRAYAAALQGHATAKALARQPEPAQDKPAVSACDCGGGLRDRGSTWTGDARVLI